MKIYRQTLQYLLVSICLLHCSACADKTPPAEPPKGVLTEAQLKAFDGARQTEQMLQETNQKQLEKIDEASGRN